MPILYNFKYNITDTKFSLFKLQKVNKIVSRSMFKLASHQGINIRLVRPNNPRLVQIRNYPDQGYTGWKTTSKIIGKDPKTGHNIYEGQIVTATGQELPQHENSHVIVRDNATGRDVGILTSAKNLQKGNINIAPENYKGELLPNGQQKPQQFRAYDQPRFSKNTQNMVKDVQATTFVQKYDKELNDAVKKANTHNKPAIVRVDKNSSELYHPDGRTIFDSNGKEIDYVN